MHKHKLGAEQGLQKSLEGLSWTAQRRKGTFFLSSAHQYLGILIWLNIF